MYFCDKYQFFFEFIPSVVILWLFMAQSKFYVYKCIKKTFIYREIMQKGMKKRDLLAFCFLKICLNSKKYVTLHPIFEFV